ncbi:hypothetical protein KSS87_004511 [Heliosperma pusillum]|nr:hypothetical protein KSS87_004511 [Heliosperma pusillum]
MASEAKTEPNYTPPQLHLTSFPNLKLLQHPYSSAMTPLHTSASVPFSWEQVPGKPLLTLPSSHHNLIKCLELPPRLVNEAKFTKTPSPTTVLEGPYYLGRSILGSSSFRFLRKRQKSFDGELSFVGSGGSSPEKSVFCNVVVTEKKGGEVREGNSVISSFSDDSATVMVGRVRRKRRKSGLSLSKSRIWKCFVEANARGTIAAAVTQMNFFCGGATRNYPPPPPINFVADHPFMFVIREDKSGAVLFVGTVLEPR